MTTQKEKEQNFLVEFFLNGAAQVFHLTALICGFSVKFRRDKKRTLQYTLLETTGTRRVDLIIKGAKDLKGRYFVSVEIESIYKLTSTVNRVDIYEIVKKAKKEGVKNAGKK